MIYRPEIMFSCQSATNSPSLTLLFSMADSTRIKTKVTPAIRPETKAGGNRHGSRPILGGMWQQMRCWRNHRVRSLFQEVWGGMSDCRVMCSLALPAYCSQLSFFCDCSLELMFARWNDWPFWSAHQSMQWRLSEDFVWRQLFYS